jgi:hypothetical protein
MTDWWMKFNKRCTIEPSQAALQSFGRRSGSATVNVKTRFLDVGRNGLIV